MNVSSSSSSSSAAGGPSRPARRPAGRSALGWLFVLAVFLGGLAVAALDDAGPQTPAERARALAESIRCPTCQGQSIADSNAAVARFMRTDIASRIEAGQTDAEIRAYVFSVYPDSETLPPRTGVGALVWFLPVAAGVAAIGGLVLVFRSWRVSSEVTVSDEDRDLVERARRAARS